MPETDKGSESNSELWLLSHGVNKENQLEDLGLDRDSIGKDVVDLHGELATEAQNKDARSREHVLLVALPLWPSFIYKRA